jgi:hypothetical protein
MNWRKGPILLACAMMLTAVVADAQTSGTDQYYLDEKIEEPANRFALGFGFGLVDLGDDLVVGNQLINNDDIEQYYAVNFRIGFGQRRSGRAGRHGSGYRGYLEPEVGYWENDTQSDTLLGLNILGATPVGGVEFFVGGGIGLHFIDTTIEQFDIDESESALGVNAQFGVDVLISDRVSLFGMGRFDLIDGDRGDNLETKATVGLRFRFGNGDGD